jgi:hypothetical protein
MKTPHTYVFVRNTKTYVSSQYFVFIHLSNTSFEHTVCEIEGGGGRDSRDVVKRHHENCWCSRNIQTSGQERSFLIAEVLIRIWLMGSGSGFFLLPVLFREEGDRMIKSGKQKNIRVSELAFVAT